GVFVSEAPEGGAMMVATDGHWLVAVRDPRGIVIGSGIVVLDAAMKKALAAHRGDVARSVHGHGAERVLIVSNKTDDREACAMIVIGGPVSKPKDGEQTDHRPETLANLDRPGRSVVATQF